MKIEKINDNQIRCTLTREDLEHHQIRISELAYGTEKAKQLFRDMMAQAQSQFGFEADNIPLMIEAIPVSAETIVLIITKVENPEELDTRFSKFTPYHKSNAAPALTLDGADSIIDLFQKLYEAKQKKSADTAKDNSASKEPAPAPSGEALDGVDLLRLFVFGSLDDVILAAHSLGTLFEGENNLYKSSKDGVYYLVLHQSGLAPEDFNKLCNVLSEYSSARPFGAASEAYLQEHSELITANALNTLKQL